MIGQFQNSVEDFKTVLLLVKYRASFIQNALSSLNYFPLFSCNNNVFEMHHDQEKPKNLCKLQETFMHCEINY